MEGSALHGRRKDVELVLLGLFMWIVIAASIVAALRFTRNREVKRAKTCPKSPALFVGEWQQLLTDYLSKCDNDKTGE